MPSIAVRLKVQFLVGGMGWCKPIIMYIETIVDQAEPLDNVIMVHVEEVILVFGHNFSKYILILHEM